MSAPFLLFRRILGFSLFVFTANAAHKQGRSFVDNAVISSETITSIGQSYVPTSSLVTWAGETYYTTWTSALYYTTTYTTTYTIGAASNPTPSSSSISPGSSPDVVGSFNSSLPGAGLILTLLVKRIGQPGQGPSITQLPTYQTYTIGSGPAQPLASSGAAPVPSSSFGGIDSSSSAPIPTGTGAPPLSGASTDLTEPVSSSLIPEAGSGAGITDSPGSVTTTAAGVSTTEPPSLVPEAGSASEGTGPSDTVSDAAVDGSSFDASGPSTSKFPGSITTGQSCSLVGVNLVCGTAGTGGQSKSSGVALPPVSSLESSVVIGGITVPVGQSLTITEPSGLTLTIGPSGIDFGSDTVLPVGTPTTMTTDGVTLTFDSAPTPDITAGPQFNQAVTEGAELPPASSEIDIVFDGETYALPLTGSVELLQTDGSTFTLAPDGVSANGQSFAVPPISGATPINVGGIDVIAQPAEVPHLGNNGENPGAGGLLDFLHGLAGAASKASSDVNSVLTAANSFANDASSFSDFLSAASGAVSDGVDTLSDFNRLMNGLGGSPLRPRWELTIDGPKLTFPAQNAGRTTIDLLKNLRRLFSSTPSPTVQTAIKAWLKRLVGGGATAGAGVALKNFGDYNWDAIPIVTASSTGTLSGTTTTTSEADEPTGLYLFSSRQNTPKFVFDEYVKRLDGGVGELISYAAVPWQSYQTELNLTQVADVKNQVWLQFIELVSFPFGTSDSENYRYLSSGTLHATSSDLDMPAHPTTATMSSGKKQEHRGHRRRSLYSRAVDLVKRATQTRDNSVHQLKLISQDPVNTQMGSQDYQYDDSLGRDMWIYIIDGGFYLNGPDLKTQTDGRRIETYIVPNSLTLPTLGKFGATYDLDSDQIMFDSTDYGTKVASAAAGVNNGVASNANLFLIKAKNSATQLRADGSFSRPVGRYTAGALTDAADRIISHVDKEKNRGKAVVNLSLGIQIPTGTSWMMTGMGVIWNRFVNWCDDNDVVLVAATGNGGPGAAFGMHSDFLGRNLPQLLGHDNNHLITVGGLEEDGSYWTRTTPPSPNLDQEPNPHPGSISVYAQSVNVYVEGMYGYVFDNGTSYAAPQVAGLAAYFLGLPQNAGGPTFRQGHFAMDMKRFIQRLAVAWTPRSDVIAANNGIRRSGGLCRRQNEGCPPSSTSAPPPLPPLCSGTTTTNCVPPGTLTSSSAAPPLTTSTAPPPNPNAAPPGYHRLNFVEWINAKQSNLQWTLYNSDGNVVGGPSFAPTISGDNLDISNLKVAKATDEKKALISFKYSDPVLGPQILQQGLGQDEQNGCLDASPWSPAPGGGDQRTLSCLLGHDPADHVPHS
ncbi:MAG: hypothetical protein M1820_005602 [Bogoriella megaspora]|nr:MAG: hypothetical protein M1820_005602 [Bogoriella megaspora]